MYYYKRISSLDEAREREQICAVYNSPSRNVTGLKTEQKILDAYEDMKRDECKLVVWRNDIDPTYYRGIDEHGRINDMYKKGNGIKIHARVTKEIEITEEQAERLVNKLCGCFEHSEIDDILKEFKNDINPGNYEAGYIPEAWIYEDLLDGLSEGETKEYLKANYMGRGVDL